MKKPNGPKEAQDIAKAPSSSPEQLHALRDSEYEFVILALSQNPSTSSETLAHIVPANMDTWAKQEIALGLANNPKTPHEALSVLATKLSGRLNRARDNVMAFRAGVALCCNASVPFPALRDALKAPETSSDFRKVVARETKRLDVLQFLSEDQSETVRKKAKSILGAG